MFRFPKFLNGFRRNLVFGGNKSCRANLSLKLKCQFSERIDPRLVRTGIGGILWLFLYMAVYIYRHIYYVVKSLLPLRATWIEIAVYPAIIVATLRCLLYVVVSHQMSLSMVKWSPFLERLLDSMSWNQLKENRTRYISIQVLSRVYEESGPVYTLPPPLIYKKTPKQVLT
jgi:hypothetical protein